MRHGLYFCAILWKREPVLVLRNDLQWPLVRHVSVSSFLEGSGINEHDGLLSVFVLNETLFMNFDPGCTLKMVFLPTVSSASSCPPDS